jgi:hypothetical protein
VGTEGTVVALAHNGRGSGSGSAGSVSRSSGNGYGAAGVRKIGANGCWSGPRVVDGINVAAIVAGGGSTSGA